MAIDGRLIIDGKRLEARERILSTNPATLESVGEAHLASSELCREAVHAAQKAFPLWRDLAAREKERIFARAKRALLRRSDEIARLVTLEKGSPLAESVAVDVLASLEVLDYHSRHLARSLRPRASKPHVPLLAGKRGAFHFHPLGPTLIISPWNFPFLIPISDVVSALTAGNTVVLRPSTTTPLCALMIGEIFLEAGLPAGVLNVVVCRTGQAEEMLTNPDVRTVMFTGSVPVGKRIMELASRNLTHVVLELGGKDPMIVLKDADLDRASRGAVWSALMNTGQSCASVERVYVAKEIEAEFTDRVVGLARDIKVGNPLDPDVDMGPLTTLGQLRVVEDHIRDAREKGARVLCGGERVAGLPGFFIQPTVLSGVNHAMKVMREETFGPVIPIMPFSDVPEAVALANDSNYGLTASVWTKNKRSAGVIAKKLEAGSVTVNDHMFSFIEPNAIWGGVKQTGMGRSHGPYGRLHLLNVKYVSTDFTKPKGQMWWYPYGLRKYEIMRNAIRLLHHERRGEKVKAGLGLLRSWPLVRSSTSFRTMLRIGARLFHR
jgi:acyl-CoA reductase-like NAD-dependent aldehyde dehydrogenase